jgi:hypothetical protein
MLHMKELLENWQNEAPDDKSTFQSNFINPKERETEHPFASHDHFKLCLNA